MSRTLFHRGQYGPVTNQNKRRVTIITGVAYSEDVEQAVQVIQTAIENCDSVKRVKILIILVCFSRFAELSDGHADMCIQTAGRTEGGSMRIKILNFWYRLQASFWFVLALMTAAAILLSFVTTAIDRKFLYREDLQQL